jgi:hypothetical protein
VTDGLFLFLACWLLAKVEIHVEGAHGWAERLPTWRFGPPWYLALTNGKPLTGYHLFLTSFLITMFHLPLLFIPFSRAVEGRILSLFFMTAVVWDFQWFVWNPAWGVRRFLTEGAWWFKKRLFGLPIDYYTGVFVSWACVRLLCPAEVSRWGAMSLTLALATLASIAFAAQWKATPGTTEGGRPSPGAAATPPSR